MMKKICSKRYNTHIKTIIRGMCPYDYQEQDTYNNCPLSDIHLKCQKQIHPNNGIINIIFNKITVMFKSYSNQITDTGRCTYCNKKIGKLYNEDEIIINYPLNI